MTSAPPAPRTRLQLEDLAHSYQHRFIMGDLIAMTVLPPEAVSSLASRPGVPTRAQQIYAPGIGQAIVNLLCLEDSLNVSPDRSVWQIRYLTGKRFELLQLQGDTLTCGEAAVAPFLAALTCGLRGDPDFTHSALEAKALCGHLERVPLSTADLERALERREVRNAFLRLSNTLYFEVQAAVARFDLCSDLKLRSSALTSLSSALNLQAGGKPLSAPLKALLTLRGGGSALLYGPPATFKTETAKALALHLGARLVVMKGDPSVEARDFKGGAHVEGIRPLPALEGDSTRDLLRALIQVTHTQNPFVWRDGPLAQAMVSAQLETTVLLIDEVLRFQGEELSVLIGAMDTVSRREARIIAPGAVGEGGDDFERLHLLRLPNEEVVACPASNLIWVMTTNVGRDYQQASDRLDPALRSRIDLCLHLESPDEAHLESVLRATCPDSVLVKVALDLERFVRLEVTSSADSVFHRPLDARKLIALTRPTLALEAAGVPREEALTQAIALIATPYLGELNRTADHDPMTRRLRDEALRSLRGASKAAPGPRRAGVGK